MKDVHDNSIVEQLGDVNTAHRGRSCKCLSEKATGLVDGVARNQVHRSLASILAVSFVGVAPLRISWSKRGEEKHELSQVGRHQSKANHECNYRF